MPSVFEALGFTKSPFFREALEPTARDYQIFIGRVSDVKKFVISINSDHGVHLVTGKRGVGKTSFVNAMQYVTSLEDPSSYFKRYSISFYPERMLPCYRKVQIDENDTVDRVLLRVISSIIFSVEQFVKENNITAFSYDLTEFENLKKQFQQIINTSLSAAEHILDANSKLELLTKIISAARKGLNRKGIYISIDNLDIIDLGFATRLLNELRDYLFIEGLCIVMLGPEGMYADLRSTEDGLRIIDRITGQETALSALSEDEAVQILDIRRRVLATDKQKIPELPLEIEYIRKLYNLCSGQMRLLFKIAETITLQVLSQYPSVKVVKSSDAEPLLKTIVENETRFSSYSKKHLEILRQCLKSPMRQRDYKELKLDSGMHFVRLANKLVQDDLLSKSSKGNAVYYEPTGLLILSKHVGLIEDEK